MRKRNIKINVFLNEDEKQMLVEKSNKAKLSQSDFIRKLINDYTNDDVIKNNLEKKLQLLKIVEDLSLLKNKWISLIILIIRILLPSKLEI